MLGCQVVARDWKCLYDEINFIHEVEEIPGHVSPVMSLDVSASSCLLSSPGFFSRLKEKGALAKDVWGVIGSA